MKHKNDCNEGRLFFYYSHNPLAIGDIPHHPTPCRSTQRSTEARWASRERETVGRRLYSALHRKEWETQGNQALQT